MMQKSYPPKVANWLNQIRLGKTKSNTTKIIDFVYRKQWEGTNVYQLRNELGMAHQTLTGTLSGIMDEGLIIAVGEVTIAGNTYSRLFIQVDPNDIARARTIRQREKFFDWCERGMKDFDSIIPPMVKMQLRSAMLQLKQ
jgi:hypothetical protein